MRPDTDPPPSGLELAIIAAVAENGVIGKDGDMPWHYPGDLEHFRETTMGSPVIMGRRTYESILDQIGRPLDGRVNVVLSSTLDDQPESNVVVARSLPEAMERAHEVAMERAHEAGDAVAYVIGGAEVYQQTLPVASRLILTRIPERPPGDTTFPAWDSQNWTEVERRTEGELTFVTYERREE